MDFQMFARTRICSAFMPFFFLASFSQTSHILCICPFIVYPSFIYKSLRPTDLDATPTPLP